jgi:hypothetical protein
MVKNLRRGRGIGFALLRINLCADATEEEIELQ